MIKHFPRRLRIAVFAASLVLPALAAQASGVNYYQQFGSAAGMRSLVNAFVDRVVADPRISAYFTHTNIPALKAALAVQFCQLEGGNCSFSMSMRSVHAQLGVTEAAFNALANDLYITMDKRMIPVAAQNDLLAKLAAMEPQVVTK